MAFTHRFRVRYAEVDPQKVVFNSRYLEYADLLVTEFFRQLRSEGLPDDLEFHVRHAEVDYRAPLRFDEEVEGRLTVERLGNSSTVLAVALHLPDTSAPAASIRLTQVHVDLETGRPSPLPEPARAAFHAHLAETVDG